MFIYMILFYLMFFILNFLMMFLYLMINKMTIFLEFELIKFMSMKIELLFLVDWISLLFILVVCLISLMVLFYSIEYMKMDLKLNQFLLLILLFIMSMLLLILSPNLMSILLGWDGLGLVSYCLVIFYQSKMSFNSGMVTVLTNRLGDVMILISISLMMSIGSWNFFFLSKLNLLIIFLLIIASFTKSAQLPFSSWLPMAMAAPTPVSSLVHSSTLVTAGVYMLVRLNHLIMNNKLINLIMCISVITMFLSGLGANFEYDLKKIIALSTLSQLGVMFFCLSMGLEEITMFHLLVHALFKSMLFLCAGVIIHNMLGNQDIRLISMVSMNLPYISILFNCSTLSLCGVPFMSGFFSKDLILEIYLMNLKNKFILVMLFLSMGLTVSYSIRLIYYSFVKLPQLNIYLKYKEVNSFMGLSMYMLFLNTNISGLMLSWLMFSKKNLIFLTLSFKLIIFCFMIIGFMLGMMISKIYLKFLYLMYINKLMIFFSMLWFMPMLYNYWIFKILKFSKNLMYTMELGWVEYFIGNNIYMLMKKMFKYDFFMKNYFYLMIFILFMIMMILLI